MLADRPAAVSALTKIFVAEIERLLCAAAGVTSDATTPTAAHPRLGAVRLIAFITEPGPIRRILTHLGEPLEPPPVSPARGPPTDRDELVQAHDDRDGFQASPDELPVSDIHSL